MNDRRTIVFVLASYALIYLSGCALISHGRFSEITREQVDAIRINETTREDIINEFGEPQKIIHKPAGEEVFIYQHGYEMSVGTPFFIHIGRAGGTGQVLTITFKNETVIYFEYVIDQRKLHK